MKDDLEKMLEKAEKPKTAEEVLGEEFGVNTDTEGWHGQEMQIDSGPLLDPGVGEANVIRAFEYHKNPEWKGKATNQEIFNLHWRQIRALLWSDGLTPNEEIGPRIVSKGDKYTIFIVAKPRTKNGIREVVADRPRKITDYLKKPN